MRDIATLAAGLLAVTLLIGRADGETASLFGYLYFVPVVAAALRFHFIGGGVSEVTAVLLQAPGVFATIERDGLTRSASAHLVTFALLIGAGVLVGRLTAAAGAQRQRF